MSDLDTRIRQSVQLLQRGNRQTARHNLIRIVEQHGGCSIAWLWLSAAVDSTEEQRYCL